MQLKDNVTHDSQIALSFAMCNYSTVTSKIIFNCTQISVITYLYNIRIYLGQSLFQKYETD